jgi:ferritin-like metal-binding protein YciE
MSTTGLAKEIQRIIEEDKVEVRFVKRVFEVALEALKSQECLDLVARMKKIYKSGEYKITWRLIFLAKFSKYHRERIERIYENADIIRGIRAEIFSKVVEHVANKVENELDTYGIPKAKLAELLLLFSTIK